MGNECEERIMEMMAELTIGLNNVCTKLGSMESALQERQRLEIPDIAKPNELEPVDDRLSDLRKCASIDERKEEEKKKELAKNEAAGMRLARTAYNGYLKGWSYTDFEEQVCLAVQNGMPMGDFHNSKSFPAKFMKYVYDEVHLLCEDFITKRTPETGFHPPVNVCVDKATSNHKSFQFTTAVVALANSEHLLANIFLGAPIVRDHTAQGLTNLICEELENNKIQASQVQGLSVDGQYIRWHVDHILKEMLKLGSTFKASWDALHRYILDSQSRLSVGICISVSVSYLD